MKNYLIILIVLIVFFNNNLYSQNSIPIPFLQPFESFNYNNKPDYMSLQVASSDTDSDTQCPNVERVISGYEYSWLLSGNSPQEGKSLKLTVRDTNQPCLGDTDLERSEILFGLPTLNQTPIFIKWNFLIPISEFPDDDIADDNHIIFQLKANNYNPDNNNNDYDNIANFPIALLNYVHKPNNGNDLKRDLYVRFNPAKRSGSEIQRLSIDDAIKKGEWNEIMFKFNLSTDDTGFFQIWVNQSPVIIYSGTASNYQSIVDVGSTQDPSKIYGANVFTDNLPGELPGIAMANNIKFGHYRPDSDILVSHSIYLDNIKVTTNSPPEEILIKLTDKYCNQQINISNQNIECYSILDATNYKFRFEHNNEYNWVNSSIPYINLLNYSFFQPATIYKVQVRAQGSNFDFNYGDICTITTASHTKLRSTDCGNTNSLEFNGTIGALKVHNATNYKFRFRRAGEPTRYHDSNDTFMRPSDLQGLTQFNIYQVDVRATGQNFDFNYGDVCSIRFTNSLKSTLTKKSMGNGNLNNIKPKVYPNPFSNEINLDCFDNVEFSYEILNQTGIIIRKKNILIDKKINLENLSNGLYFLKLTNSTNTFIYKIYKE
jgi:hypothetical protein